MALRFNINISYVAASKPDERYTNATFSLSREACSFHVLDSEKVINVMVFDVQAVPDAFLSVEGFLVSKNSKFDLVFITIVPH